jgi:hypothetical protein
MKRLNSWLLGKMFRSSRRKPIRRAEKTRLTFLPLEERTLLSNQIVHGTLPYAVGGLAGDTPLVSSLLN